MGDKRLREKDRGERQARRDLDRVSGEGGFMGSPYLKGKAASIRDHFSGRDADQSDPIEVSATRMGRLLGLVAFVALALWLLAGGL